MDNLLKALVLNNEARVYLVNSTKTVNDAIQSHDLWPSATSVLGKALSMGLIMGAMLKNDASVTIKLNGNGPLGNVIVDYVGNYKVRGYVDHPHVNFVNNSGGLNDVYALGSDGMIDVIKDLKLKDLFTSSIALSGSLADDFTYYFYESDQTRSVVGFSMIVNPNNLCEVSGAIVVQLLPFASEKTIEFLEHAFFNIDINDLFLNNDLEVIVKKLFCKDYEILEQHEVEFFCPCSKDTFLQSLLTIGKKNLKEIISEDHKIEAVCHYCNKKYLFTEEEINNVIGEE